MFNVNLKQKNPITLKALSLTDKLAKDKKPYSFFNEGHITYFVIDKKDVCPKSLDWNLNKAIASLKFAANIDLDSFISLLPKQLVKPFIINAFFNHEVINFMPVCYKTKGCKSLKHNFILDAKLWKQNQKEIEAIIEGANFARSLMLEPNNVLSPNEFTKRVNKAFMPYKTMVDIKTLNYEQMVKKGMGLITAVGRGSNKEFKPMMMSICFKNTKPSFTLVGKGITYDTGGLNLKINGNMYKMHMDMSGAAISAGIMLALCKLNKKANFAVVLALSNNDIGPDAYRMNDVYRSYNGQTVEITNTDAEGRLILADAMTYAIRDLKTHSLATIATLTGAIGIALGNVMTGYWSTCNLCANNIEQAATETGEYIWRMPLHQEYANGMINKTLIADFANFHMDTKAGSAAAAEFLHFFSENKPYMHFDIAFTNERMINGVLKPFPTMLRTFIDFVNNVHSNKNK